jgi:hypothetical protein
LKGFDLAIPTAVMAMKLHLVTDAETFRKTKVDISFCHDKTMLYAYSRTCHPKRNQQNAQKGAYVSTSMVPFAWSLGFFRALGFGVRRVLLVKKENARQILNLKP